MLKKFLLSSAIVVATAGTAIASPAPYVGASIGITNNYANVTDSSFGLNGQSEGTYRGVPFNVFAGYGGVVSQNFYLAGELGATIGTANISKNSNLKSGAGVSASIIPGIMLSDHTLAFARAGVVRTKLNKTPDTDTAGDKMGTRTGGEVGLGLQTSLTQCVDLRGEYDFVSYRSKTVDGMKISPRSDQVAIGLVYKFD